MASLTRLTLYRHSSAIMLFSQEPKHPEQNNVSVQVYFLSLVQR